MDARHAGIEEFAHLPRGELHARLELGGLVVARRLERPR